jgi:hypothetical protein
MRKIAIRNKIRTLVFSIIFFITASNVFSQLVPPPPDSNGPSGGGKPNCGCSVPIDDGYQILLVLSGIYLVFNRWVRSKQLREYRN